MSPTLWGPVHLTPGMEVTHGLGSLRLDLKRTPEEIWLHASHADPGGEARWLAHVGDPRPAVEHGAASSGEEAAVPGEDVSASPPSEPTPVAVTDWTRWAMRPDDVIELRPSFPDRPLVVATEQPFFLPPEGRARMFVRVPLFVSVDLVGRGGGSSPLERLPSTVLSDTWWGDPTGGEIAYWLGTRARRQVTDDVFEPALVICPFMLINESEQPLPVERFVVRVAYLTLFGRGEALWADEVQVRYQGGVEESDIRYTGRVPDEAGRVERIAGSREHAPRGLKARMFGRLRGRAGAL